MRTQQVLQTLRSKPHPNPKIDSSLIARATDLFEKRDVLAHSASMNIWGRSQHGFVKLNRPDNKSFRWHGFETQELEDLARELSELAELVQSIVLT